ncbi:hypothetical protein SAMN04490248_1292 [Salinihabitans flavidus]|uniref:Uncharacterized protein n=1 Tax=Salinihabitans flavidus TaxID=569882 RepID=A0A1H8VFZ9_9RHOB|nr:hypothetical protein [Salinihabitans flavidus]SEP14319.1 hypothetical protein SAMN04490248_1292 [Salinihabitans flavidus]
MDDLQRSETVIAKILSLLMEWGIQETQLEFSELDLSDEYRPFFFSCVKWLEAEGVIRCPIPDDHIDPRRTALFMARSILREVRDEEMTC